MDKTVLRISKNLKVPTAKAALILKAAAAHGAKHKLKTKRAK